MAKKAIVPTAMLAFSPSFKELEVKAAPVKIDRIPSVSKVPRVGKIIGSYKTQPHAGAVTTIFFVATLLIERAIVASFPAETIQKTFYLTTESMP